MSTRKKNRTKARRKTFSEERYRQYRNKQNRKTRREYREELNGDIDGGIGEDVFDQN